jgi:hypothetical protein
MSETTIRHITSDDVKGMTDIEGLILQGCGGDPAEWIAGINKLLTEEGILLDGDLFKEAYIFEHDGHTNILLSMENVKLDIGKLAMWRLKSHSAFGGYWLSDYLPNRLGVRTDAQQTVSGKPQMQLAGMDGNIFNILGNASRLLKENGMEAQAKEMFERATAAGSYEQALMIVSEYVQTELSESEQIQEAKYETRGFERLYKTILRDESMPRANLERTLYEWYLAAPDGEYLLDNEGLFINRLRVSTEKPYASLIQTCRSLYALEGDIFEGLDGGPYTPVLVQVGDLYRLYCHEYKERYGIPATSAISSWKLCEASLYPSAEIYTELNHGYIARLDSIGPKHIYICAPLRNDVERNVEAARLFAKEVFEAGDIPICPHLIFPPIADPNDPAQDEKAFGMCLKLIEGCHQINVYGQPTVGMQAEIAHAKRMGIPVRESSPVKEKGRGKPSQTRCPSR